MFDHALQGLIGTLTKAGLRQVWRVVKKPSGAAMAFLMFGMIGIGVLPQIAIAFSGHESMKSGLATNLVGALPLLMYLMTTMLIVTDAGKSLMELRAPELQFVLAGPFTNSQILSYRLTTLLIGWVFLSLFFGVFMMVHFATLVGGVLFVGLGGSFMMVLTFTKTMLTPRLQSRQLGMIRLAALLGVLAIVAEGSVHIRQAGDSETLAVLGEAVKASWSVGILGAPFKPFSNLAVLPLGASWLFQFLIAIALLVTATFVCYRCNSGFAELAVEGVARRQKKLARIKGGNVYAVGSRKTESKPLLPAFPWLSGFGPVAWYQVTSAIRRSGRLTPGVVCIGVVAAIGAVAVRHFFPAMMTPGQKTYVVVVAMAAATYLGFLVSMTGAHGFTASKRLLIWFQTMPFSALPLAAGMTMGTMFILFCLRIAVFAPAFVLSGQTVVQRISMLAAWLAFDLAFSSVMNLVAASSGLRPIPQGTPDIFQGVRGMTFMLVLAVAMLPMMMIAAMVVGIAVAIFGLDWTPCSLAAAIGLLCPIPFVWWLSGYRFLNRELASD